MTDRTGLGLLVLIFIVAAVLISKSVPQDVSELQPKIVKTIAIDTDDELDRQLVK